MARKIFVYISLSEPQAAMLSGNNYGHYLTISGSGKKKVGTLFENFYDEEFNLLNKNGQLFGCSLEIGVLHSTLK